MAKELLHEGSFVDPGVEAFFDTIKDDLHDQFVLCRFNYHDRRAYLQAYRQLGLQLVTFLRQLPASLPDTRYLMIDLRLMLEQALRELEHHEADVQRRLRREL